MATNPYFNNYSFRTEQDLVDDLLEEAIQIHGIDLHYVLRTKTNVSKLYTEDRVSRYDNAVVLEMYPENINGFGGESDLISKFGLEIRDEVKFVISIRRWKKEVGDPFDRVRPLEGDLIFLPEPWSQIFEITFVEHEKIFYQLGKLMVYQLKCRLFEYSNQVFDTGVPMIDFVGNTFDRNLENIPLETNDDQILVTMDGETLVRSDPLSVSEDNRAMATDLGDLLFTTDNQVLVVADVEPSDNAQNDTFEELGDRFINFDERDPFNTRGKF